MGDEPSVLFGRYEEEPLLYRHPSLFDHGPVMILDLWGERGVEPLRDRLLKFNYLVKPRIVVLRGVSLDLHSEARSEQGQLDLLEAFPEAAVFELSIENAVQLNLLCGSDDRIDRVALSRLVHECELAAQLQWSDAVWTDPLYHFVAPSGQHADKFVRVGDLFGEPLHVSRVADWFSAGLDNYSCLVSDTVSLLPLLQELRIRNLGRTGSDIPVRIIPHYGNSEKNVAAAVEEVAPLARESQKSILVVVSVNATGGYIRALEKHLARHPDLPPTKFRVICQVGGEPNPLALTHIESAQYPRREVCDLCKAKSLPLEIDERKFTTRLGSKMLGLPRPEDMQANAPLIVDLAAKRAFRVHVDRPDRHDHLTVYIDTKRLLESEIFLAHARVGFARCLLGFSPDLVLVPNHDGTCAIQAWLASIGYPSSIAITLDGELEQGTKVAIERSEKILICDDCVITSRTLRATLETIQTIKEGVGKRDFKVRAFVLVARPASKELWAGIRSRFYINNQHSLYVGWELGLPDRGYGDRDICPWCVERSLLESYLPHAPREARTYLEDRLERLRSREGLETQIFLGSEVAGRLTGWETAVHTSPSSYLGSTSDIGTFVSIAALIQKIRADWDSNIERWSTAYAIPLHTALQRFTDPVIAAAFLRAIYPYEVRTASVVNGLTEVLGQLDHVKQHPVLSAEIILAAAESKLPKDVDYTPMLHALIRFPETERTAIKALHKMDTSSKQTARRFTSSMRTWIRRIVRRVRRHAQ